MELYRVIQIGEADYGCEELPEGAPVLCHVSLEGSAGESWTWKSLTPPWRRETSRRETPCCGPPTAWKR